MLLRILLVCVCAVLADDETASNKPNAEDIVGSSLDIFANYGDLSQMMQVISGDYDDADPALFTEDTIRIFQGVRHDTPAAHEVDNALSFSFCDTLDDLMGNYYKHFAIDGSTKPWKAFMGDWIPEELMHSLGLRSDPVDRDGYCCFVLVRISKTHNTFALRGSEDNYSVTEQIQEAINDLKPGEINIKKFTRSYGTHYVQSFSTGNSLYQVFVYYRHVYRSLKHQMRYRRSATLHTDDLRFFTSSFFLKQIGKIKVASGNKTIEDWCEENFNDSQYLYSRPTLLKLYNNVTLLQHLNRQLDDGAVTGIRLKMLTSLFKEEEKRRLFEEIVDNEIKLWEGIN